MSSPATTLHLPALRRSEAVRCLKGLAASQQHKPRTPACCDPRVRLGTDIFHDILQLLPVPDLLGVERVSTSWKLFSRTNGALWRSVCRREPIQADEIRKLDYRLRTLQRVAGEDTPWRSMCLELIPLYNSWINGRVQFRSLDYSLNEGIPGKVAFIDDNLLVRSTVRGLSLSNHRDTLVMAHHDPPYTHLEACGDFIVGMYTSNHLDSACPKPLPTRIDLWKVVRSRSGNHWLQSFGPLALDPSPLWGYTLRLHMESPLTDHARLIIAVLAGSTKRSEMSDLSHWTAVHKGRFIQMWKIDISEPNRQPDPAVAFRLEPHIAADEQMSLARMIDTSVPLPVTYVATLGAMRNDELYWAALGLAHYRPVEYCREAHAKCRTTTRDLIVTSPAGALVILRNYRFLLGQLGQLPPSQRVAAIVPHTILIATGRPVDDIATHDDHIVLRVTKKRDVFVTIDSGNELPELPLAAPTRPRGLAAARNSLSALPPPSPRLFARIIVGPHQGDAACQSGLWMGTHAIFCPAAVCVRALYFAKA